MAAKAAIKDVGRAMDIPYADVDRIAKMVPTTLNIKLEQAIKDSPALQQAYDSEPQVRQLFDTARNWKGWCGTPVFMRQAWSFRRVPLQS